MANTIIVTLNDYEQATNHRLVYAVFLAATVMSLAATVYSMKPEYRHTFIGSKTGRQFWREHFTTDVLHESHQSLDEQRVYTFVGAPYMYIPADLVMPFLLKKATEMEQARSSSSATFVAPRWLTNTFVDEQDENIKYWLSGGTIDEDKARELSEAVQTMRNIRCLNQFATVRTTMGPGGLVFTSSNKPLPPRVVDASAVDTSSSAPVPNLQISVEHGPGPNNRLPRLQGAKVVPTDLVEVHSLPPIHSAAPPEPERQLSRTRSLGGSERQLTRSQSLGVAASTLNPRRRSSAAAESGLAMVPALARELACVMQEARLPAEAVVEWWDVNVTPRADAEVEREVLVQLIEEMRPALLVGKVFVEVFVRWRRYSRR